MAIYSPPKQSQTGSILSGAGNIATTIGGAMTATGVGAVPGMIIAGAGAIASVAGNVIDSSNKQKIEAYNQKYNSLLEGENNSKISAYNNSLANISAYNASGINSSIKSINTMLEPMSTKSKVSQGSGTTIIDNRLI